MHVNYEFVLEKCHQLAPRGRDFLFLFQLAAGLAQNGRSQLVIDAGELAAAAIDVRRPLLGRHAQRACIHVHGEHAQQGCKQELHWSRFAR